MVRRNCLISDTFLNMVKQNLIFFLQTMDLSPPCKTELWKVECGLINESYMNQVYKIGVAIKWHHHVMDIAKICFHLKCWFVIDMFISNTQSKVIYIMEWWLNKASNYPFGTLVVKIGHFRFNLFHIKPSLLISFVLSV